MEYKQPKFSLTCSASPSISEKKFLLYILILCFRLKYRQFQQLLGT
jgi:hypothetical protein